MATKYFNRRGTGCYRRTFDLAEDAPNAFLVVEGCALRARFWLDGREIGFSKLPWSRLEFPTGALKAGRHERGILALLDMGHFHISENVADKISSFLMFFGKVAFHISRPVRWDSDHVIRQNDDLRNAAQEIVRMGPENFIIALDYFDASINRVAAWVLGMRNMQKYEKDVLLKR